MLSAMINEMAMIVCQKMENVLVDMVQSFADEQNISFECALKFFKKYYYITYDVECKKGEYFLVMDTQFKSVDVVLSEDYEIGYDCEKELLRR